MSAMKPTRATVAVISLVLTLATALTLTVTAVTLASPRSSTDAPASLAIVRPFYAALNRAIATGDLGDLEALVAPDVTVDGDGAAGLDGLRQRLLDLHATRPGLWLSLDETLVD